MKISAVILTKNEEKNIEKCLESVNFCDEIIIIDDYSEDKTIEVIKKLGVKSQNLKSKVKIYQKQLKGDFANQRNYGMNQVNNDWILFIDADEEISKELSKEIVKLLNSYIVKEDAFYIKRRDFFWRKELRFGETRRVRNYGLIRLVKKNSGKWIGNVHEVFFTSKKTSMLNGYLDHYPHPTLKEFIHKVNIYSTLRAKDLLNKGKKTNTFEIIVWPIGKFIFNYFFNLGFLDGPAGFTYAFIMSFHSYLVRAKLFQFQQQLNK